MLRLSSLYGGHIRRTIVDWLLRQAQTGQRVTAYPDRTVQPINCTMSSAKLCGQVVGVPRRWSDALSDYLFQLGLVPGGRRGCAV